MLFLNTNLVYIIMFSIFFQDNELNLDGFLEEVKTSGIKDTWLLDTIIEDKKICYAVSLFIDSFNS